MAREAPIVPPIVHGSRYQLFISIAGWLQRLQGEASIMLPVKKLANKLGVTANTISIYRKWAKDEGLLVEAEAYVRPGRGRGQATQFRFAIEMFPELFGGMNS